MSKLNRLPVGDRLPFICGAVLLLATLAMAQHALDANLRVGSGGYNSHRRPQVTMTRSPYALSAQGTFVHNKGAAYGSPEVYSRRNYVYMRDGGKQSPTQLGRTRPAPQGALAMQRSPYSANRSAGRPAARGARPGASRAGIKSVRRQPSAAKSASSMKRAGYWAGSAASQMQTPTLQLQRQTYKPTGTR